VKAALRRVVGLGLFASLATTVEASPVLRSAFAADTKVEGFEHLNRPQTPIASANLPTPFMFPSGVKLTAPAPNRNDSSGVFIVDNGGFYGLGAGEYVPDGTAYLGQANPNLFTGPIVFTFTGLQARVGALIAVATPDSPQSFVTMSVYGTDDRLLESITTRGVQPSGWANNFVGLERGEGITKVAFSSDGGGVLRLDDLTFQAVPVPAGFWVGMSCLPAVATAAGYRRRRRG
jgi:hypothetical protein